MTFFTTPELLEIGDIPFPSPNPKPLRNEALQYYRLVAAHYKLDVRPNRSSMCTVKAPSAPATRSTR